MTPIRISAFALLLSAAIAALLPVAFPFHCALVPAVAGALLRIDLGSSGPAAPFLIINAVVSIAVAIWGLKRGSPPDGMRLALFSAAMTGVLLAQSIVAFLLFWEGMSLVSAFLVATNHGKRFVRRAVFSYALVSQLGALSITAFLAILAVHAGTGAFAGIALASGTLPTGVRIAALSLAALGFGSKAGLVPLQFWLPRAHPAAPANASAMLSGIMLKLAVYGLLLACFVLAAPAPWAIGVALLLAGAASALLGGLYAAVESDIKRLLAFSSIENVGIIVATLGLAVLAAAMQQPALAALAIVALLFHSVNHAMFKSLLFLGAGTLVERLHVTNLDQLGGLAKGALRRSALWMLLACMAASALPPLNGFASEWLVFNGFIHALAVGSPWFKALALFGIAALATTGGLAAAAFVKLYGVGFLGEPRHPAPVEPEPFDASDAALALLGAASVAIGMIPSVVLRPLSQLAGGMMGEAPLPVPNLSVLPFLALLPVAGAVFAVVTANRRGVREAGTWTCGSVVTLRSQYTATVLSKPLRLIFGFALFPQRERRTEYGTSRWIPTRITYVLSTRYVFDELARNIAAFVQRVSRGARRFQGGFLRVYLGYALAAFLAALAVAR